MWPKAILILACLMQICAGITVTEKIEQSSRAPYPVEKQPKDPQELTMNYRVSAPKPQHSSNRVPAHLQGIQRGYVYDDADDVIHIIEPPQHFRELKRLINQNGDAAAVWEQRSKVHINRPQASSAPESADIKKPPTKVKELFDRSRPETAKVEIPLRLRNTKPVPAGKNKRRFADLQTQESKMQPGHYLQHFSAPTQALQQQLPVEILASVRKTERFVHTNRAPVAPLTRQRHKSHKTHTVISEKGYEHEQFQRGQEMRIYGEKHPHRKNSNLEKLGRGKREIRQTTRATQAQQVTHHAYDTQKGNKLLLHISELLKNATFYVPDLPNDAVNATTATTLTTTNKSSSLLEELRTRFQHNSQPKPLIGEIEPTQTPKQLAAGPQPPQVLEESVLIKILENSLNATDAIMSEIMRKKNDSNSNSSTTTCATADDNIASSPSHRFQSLQNRINCIRDQVFSKNAEALKTNKKRYGERTREKATTVIALPKSTTEASSRRYKKLRNFARGSYKNNKNGVNKKNTTTTTANALDKIPAPPQLSDADARNLSAVLLYDDIMTNIRNMLQARNLKLLEEQQTVSAEAAAVITLPFLDAAPPTEAERDESDFGNFRDLNQYLNELQQIVANLPTTAPPANATTTELTLNSRELSRSESNGGDSTYPPRADWYLINGSGKIFQTHLNDELKPTATIFHRFPDIPNATDYLRTHTFLNAQSKTFEIL